MIPNGGEESLTRDGIGVDHGAGQQHDVERAVQPQ
jgi:hypothetical protein